MGSRLTEEQAAFAAAVRDFAKRECGAREQRDTLTGGGREAHHPGLYGSGERGRPAVGPPGPDGDQRDRAERARQPDDAVTAATGRQGRGRTAAPTGGQGRFEPRRHVGTSRRRMY